MTDWLVIFKISVCSLLLRQPRHCLAHLDTNGTGKFIQIRSSSILHKIDHLILLFQKSPQIYGIRDTGTKRWLEGRVNIYNTTLFTRPETNKRVERPIAPVRSYVRSVHMQKARGVLNFRYMGTDDAIDMYKNKYMTVGTLSKYWLSPTNAYTRRQRDLNIGSKTFTSDYNSYSSRFANRSPYYSKVVSRLQY